jgi:plasmid maintenance system antidote protein VapI
MMLRLATKEDFIEDLYLAVRELVEHHDVQPREIRRFVNQALKDTPPKAISDRVKVAHDVDEAAP